MIGQRVIKLRGKEARRYIAMRLENRLRPIWAPISGDVECIGEPSLTAAVRTCIRSLDERFTRVLEDTDGLRASTQHAEVRDQIDQIHTQIARLHIEVVRLLDGPTHDDSVRTAAKLGPAPLTGEQLTAARRLAGLTIHGLAAKSRITTDTIREIESKDTRFPRAATTMAIVQALWRAGVELDGAGWFRVRKADHATLTVTPDRADDNG